MFVCMYFANGGFIVVRNSTEDNRVAVESAIARSRVDVSRLASGTSTTTLDPVNGTAVPLPDDLVRLARKLEAEFPEIMARLYDEDSRSRVEQLAADGIWAPAVRSRPLRATRWPRGTGPYGRRVIRFPCDL